MAVTALYIHIPFCAQKCRYCDFDSRALSPHLRDEAMDRYFELVDARLREFARAGALSDIDTVYIGGGTPSLAGERLVRLCRSVSRVTEPSEFSCEANPESMTAALAAELKEAGVTRVSLGIQTLDGDELASIGRIHSASRALDALRVCKIAGLDVSCDLMCGLPGQTARSWRSTLEGIVAAAPDHVSVYPLTVEEGTPLWHAARKDPSLEPDEDFQADCMDVARLVLDRAGYRPYEVASYARPGHSCRHNIAYWTGRGYLGIGRSSAMMLDRCDFDRLRLLFPGVKLSDGCARVRLVQTDDVGRTFDIEELGPREAMAEDLMLACRMTAGIPANLLRRATSVIPADEISRACERAVELGLACWSYDGAPLCSVPAAEAISDPRNLSLAPTHLGWLDGNVLFELFWGLHGGSGRIATS